MSSRDSNWNPLDPEDPRDRESMTPIDEEELPVTTDVDNDLVISIEPITSDVFIG